MAVAFGYSVTLAEYLVVSVKTSDNAWNWLSMYTNGYGSLIGPWIINRHRVASFQKLVLYQFLALAISEPPVHRPRRLARFGLFWACFCGLFYFAHPDLGWLVWGSLDACYSVLRCVLINRNRRVPNYRGRRLMDELLVLGQRLALAEQRGLLTDQRGLILAQHLSMLDQRLLMLEQRH